MSRRDDSFEALLANQLQMNPQTWAQLQARGADETTLLVLDFFYTAPGESQAQALVAFLQEKTTFSVEAVLERGTFRRKRWRVVGKTMPSTTSIAMLNDWVTFMVKAGAKHGMCHFDGWGVEIPEPYTAAERVAKSEEPSGADSRQNGTVAALAAERADEPDEDAERS